MNGPQHPCPGPRAGPSTRRCTTKAVIFDIYNTLFDNGYQTWVETFQTLCHEQRISRDPEELFLQWRNLERAERRDRVNLEEPDKSPPFRTYGAVWEECFARLFVNLGLEADPMAATERVVTDLALRKPFPESQTVVTQLSTWYRTAVLSNADDAFLRPLLERYNLPLDPVLSSEGVRAYKPHPRAFQQTLAALQVAPGEALYVGDTLYDDITGAHRAGMVTALVNRGGATAISGGSLDSPADTPLVTPDYQVRDLTELLEILKPAAGGVL